MVCLSLIFRAAGRILMPVAFRMSSTARTAATSSVVVLALCLPAMPAVEDQHAGAEPSPSTAEHGGSGGVNYDEPPLGFEGPLFCFSLLLFVAFLFVARRYVWTPLIGSLDAREARVNQALHDAEAARVEAEALLAQHQARIDQVQDEVKGIVAAARGEAEADKAKIIAQADQEASALRDQAIADIKQAHQQALDELASHIDAQVAVATDHVLRRNG